MKQILFGLEDIWTVKSRCGRRKPCTPGVPQSTVPNSRWLSALRVARKSCCKAWAILAARRKGRPNSGVPASQKGRSGARSRHDWAESSHYSIARRDGRHGGRAHRSVSPHAAGGHFASTRRLTRARRSSACRTHSARDASLVGGVEPDLGRNGLGLCVRNASAGGRQELQQGVVRSFKLFQPPDRQQVFQAHRHLRSGTVFRSPAPRAQTSRVPSLCGGIPRAS